MTHNFQLFLLFLLFIMISNYMWIFSPLVFGLFRKHLCIHIVWCCACRCTFSSFLNTFLDYPFGRFVIRFTVFIVGLFTGLIFGLFCLTCYSWTRVWSRFLYWLELVLVLAFVLKLVSVLGIDLAKYTDQL